MAFVYRSEKESLFDRKESDSSNDKRENISNQQSQLNGTTYNEMRNSVEKSPGKLSKGLPSLLKKDKNLDLNLPLFEKQNSNNEQKKHEGLKFNLKKLKQISESYFFSSKVPREIDFVPLKSLNKNITCTQFTTDLNKMNEIVSDPIKQIPPNYTDPNYVDPSYIDSNMIVNKSLIDPQMTNNCKKSFKQSITNNSHGQKMVANFSSVNEVVKRKSALPQSLQKTTYQTALKKAKDVRQLNRQKSVDNVSQNFMNTLNQQSQQPLKRNFTEKRLKKLHKGNLQNSFYKESESQSQQSQQEAIPYSKEVPGPGSYNNTIDLKQKKSFRSRKQKFAKIFVSPLDRFVNDGFKYQEITYVNEQCGKKQKIYPNQVFVSKTPKGLQLQKRTSSPPPGTYDPRESIEHDVVRNLLKSSNVPNFSSSMPRFNYPKPDPNLGPGSYNHELIQQTKKQEVRNQLTSSYKSQVKRYENNCNQSNKSKQNFNGDNNQLAKIVIHKREQHFDSSEFFSSPPFFSSVERFPQHDAINDFSGNYYMKGQRKTHNSEKLNPQPFNSSAKRIINQPVGFGVGVGSYLIQKDSWNKKSYNVYFH